MKCHLQTSIIVSNIQMKGFQTFSVDLELPGPGKKETSLHFAKQFDVCAVWSSLPTKLESHLS